MPNDAKLGLVIGVGLVVAVAVVFFRKEPASNMPLPAKTASLAGVPVKNDPIVSDRGSFRQTPAQPATRTEITTTPAGTRHTVQEGETLASLALRYYGDKEKSAEILKVNRDSVSDADNLTPGTVLTIPELPAQSDSSSGKEGS